MERISGLSYERSGRSPSLKFFTQLLIWRSIFKWLYIPKRWRKKNFRAKIQYCNKNCIFSAHQPWDSGDFVSAQLWHSGLTTGRLLTLCRSTLFQDLGINTLTLLQKLLGTRPIHAMYLNEEIRLWDLFTAILGMRNRIKLKLEERTEYN